MLDVWLANGQSGPVLVEIVAVESVDPLMVRFRCEAGTGVAIWRDTGPLIVGSSHDVEVDHERPLRWLTSGELTDDSASSCRLAATVEAIDEDSLVRLRVGEGVMIASLAEGEQTTTIGTSISLVDVELTLWPTNI